MQKKIIALAIVSAISAPAFADNANVSLYGKAFLNVESFTSDKPLKAIRVQTNASRFGLKGSEDLGEGLKALYQYEVQMDADGSAKNGLGNSTRNSGVGIEAETLGKVILGMWDSPYKLTHNTIELFDNTTVFTTTRTIGRTVNEKDYNTRNSNSLIYWSPKLLGVQLAGQYSANETDNKKNQISLSGTFEYEDMYLAGAFESRPEVVAKTTDSALRGVAKYKLGDFWVGAAVESIKVNTSATASYSQTNFEGSGLVKLGASNIGAAFVKTGKSSAADTGATQFSLRYGYNFSKRTEVFAAYTNLKNEKSAKYTLSSSHTGSAESAMGLGVIHSF